MAPMLGGDYTLHRKTQARLRNGDMLTLCMKTENSEDWTEKKSAAVMLISIWDLALYLQAEKQFS